ncbi:hypothetical protein B0A78_03350 [Flavobacterium columnare NBRC 100251 = ATCC 23463]|uniref:Uncharacterized protein n=1 Tax=Flavobacterium columnare (strain ATCC 49512 / CIP 103533 / TG 44/87) TaxID=1041826 RepID=G8X8V5_FLACA|nr:MULTISPECIES: hypothetical protein [Flavobacterium]AEW87188.1 hypothetical protein FCOL_11935 [Flavobacterium columnare ATCC 49512]AMA48489.1 hypothetical protein AWN65_02965 [Flavobacterium covae]ANO47498.1 hypothetical protein Pf1_02043 [Flavobacterium columnare]APT21866.1 hypothetical protein BU993_03960 [Flavobacterium columnare]MBF6651315.1 hypothetical protein [Flavobacterium columnare]
MFKILNNKKVFEKKGWISFLLAFLLLLSISGKSFSNAENFLKIPVKIDKEKNSSKSKIISVNQSLDDEELTELDLEDDNIEEFIFSKEYVFSLQLLLLKKDYNAIGYKSFKLIYNQPLYILYCNWKYDLV